MPGTERVVVYLAFDGLFVLALWYAHLGGGSSAASPGVLAQVSPPTSPAGLQACR
ncbi:MAG: hypothetical protein IPL33_05790 [Sphingobacteriales bacterium]|nr:hypothetical protein [Sphingobacteriales bacterium]